MIDKDNFADFVKAAGGLFVGLAGGLAVGYYGQRTVQMIVGNIRDKVREPKIGSIVICDFYGMEHTGIYVGNGFIVSLSKTGRVKKERPYDFIKRTPAEISGNIYVSCKGKNLLGIRNALKEL